MEKKKKRFLKPIIILAVICVAAFGVYKAYPMITASKKTEDIGAKQVSVTKGDISKSITGTGTVVAANSYDIVSLVQGTIQDSPFEEGDSVKKGDLLYRIDDSDLLISIQRGESSLKQQKLTAEDSKDSLSNLTVTAPADGYVTEVNAIEDQDVPTVIATIGDYKNTKLEAQFFEWQKDYIKVGCSASIWSGQNGSMYSGTVSYIDPVLQQNSKGETVVKAEITLNSNAVISSDSSNSVVIRGTDGKQYQASGSITVSSNKTYEVKTTANGTVDTLYIKKGDYVKKGQKILKLKNDSLYTSLEKNQLSIKDAELSIDQQKKQLEDYNITSPADGTVVTKDFKAGDTIPEDKTLMTIADLSKLKFTIDVDELDIADIKTGLPVDITSDALPNEKFEGVISNVPLVGTNTNGVTTYAVEVTINNPGNLKLGMNVNAEVIVESKTDVLEVPIEAIVSVGDKSYVRTAKVDSEQTRENKKEAGSFGENADNKNLAASDSSGENRSSVNKAGSEPNESTGAMAAADNAGDTIVLNGYVLKRIETGIENSDYIEVLSGLSEGDKILVVTTSTTKTTKENTVKSQGMGGGNAAMGGGPPM